MAGRRQNLRAKRGAGGQTSAPLWPFPACPHTAEGLFDLDDCALWPRQGVENSVEPNSTGARLTTQKARCDSCPRSPRSLLSDALIGKTPQFCGVLFLAPLRSILAQKVPSCDFAAATTSG